MGTATLVLKALEAFDLKPGRGGEYSCNSPLRPGSNSHAFHVLITDEEHGAYYDFARNGEETAHGSLYQLAKRMDIPLPERAPAQVTHRVYTGLEDYAKAHYSTAEVFAAAGWEQCEQWHRPALRFPTSGGIRLRYLDGDEKRRWSFDEKGGRPCWYGFKAALPQVVETGQPLIFCNGEPSVVVAQSYGLPAVTITSGEKASIKPDLLAELVKAYPPAEDDHEIIVALDCDTTGRQCAPGIVDALRKAGYKARAVDLMLTDSGDLADFCGLHGKESAYADFLKLPELKTESPAPAAAPKVSVLVSWKEASERARAGYHDHAELKGGVPLPVPFKQIAQFEGQAALLEPGNVMCIGAPTGHAKTSLMEAMVDYWRRDRGATGAMWGPEFRPDFYVYKAVQRAGGPSANQVRWHKLAMRGMTDHSGLTQAEIDHSNRLIDEIEGWSGGLFFVEKMTLTVEQVIENYKEAMELNGGTLDFAVLDYAQLILGEKSAATVEANLALFKGFCVDNHVVGLVGSQVTKAGSSSGGWIDLEALRYMNGDYFNCIVTVCRQEDPTGKFLPDAKMSVVKNSLGSCGRGTLFLHQKTMLWQDPVIHNVNVEKATITQVPM